MCALFLGVWGRHCEVKDAGVVYRLSKLYSHSQEWSPEHAAVLHPGGGGSYTGTTP